MTNPDIQNEYPLNEFKYNQINRIFYSPSFRAEDYNYSDGKQIEDYILSAIRNANDVSDGSPELLAKIKDWPTYYHFGIERANIIRCLDIRSNSKIIEFGAGCGAITRHLGENYYVVDSVEGSITRAQITRERCRDLKNVQVFCSNIENVQLNHQYDLVTLIGVLEYAPVYFSSYQNPESACLSLLKRAHTAIKGDGALILAIENKIGLKYWSGCHEDHTGIFFEGLQGYPNQPEPITFSKKEITVLLKAAGFNNCVILSCFPDYKLASTLIKDIDDGNNYCLYNWIETPFKEYDAKRKYSFHEGLALKTLYDAGLLGDFANSLLIIASNEESNPIGKIDWVAKKLSVKRRKEMRCQTSLKLKPHIFIEKKRINGNIDITVNNDKFRLHHHVSDATWIPGNTLLYDMCAAACNKDSYNSICIILSKYFNEAMRRYSTGQTDKHGYPLLKGSSVDFIPKNIIISNNKFESIDEEYILDDNIPGDYLLFRCILQFFAAQGPWAKKRFWNETFISIKLMRTIFPRYNIIRHRKNMQFEISFHNLVTSNINFDYEMNNNYFQTLMSAILMYLQR